MMVSLRRMVQGAAWGPVMAVLAQARIEADDSASVPPLVMVKPGQVLDILCLLEPFEEALQVQEVFFCRIKNRRCSFLFQIDIMNAFF